MPDQNPSNVKIYDRPETKKPPLLLLIIGLIVFIAIAFGAYKMFFAAKPATNLPASMLVLPSYLSGERLSS